MILEPAETPVIEAPSECFIRWERFTKKGLSTYKTYTTRPKRDDHDDGYHFITAEEAKDIPEEDKILKTEINGYEYFGRKSEITSDEYNLFVLDPDGFYELAHFLRDESILLFYVNADSMTRIARGTKRKEGAEVFFRRSAAEDERFNKFEATLLWMLDNPTAYSPKNVEVFRIENTFGMDVLNTWAEVVADRVASEKTEDEETRTERLNKRLYEKMCAEQNEYKKRLLKMEPEKILNYAYEFALREDIVCAMENNSLEADEAETLLKLENPLETVMDLYEDSENSYYMENIWDTICYCARNEMNER